MQIQHVRSKWAKTNALLADSHMKRFVPATRRFSRQNVKKMLDEYGLVYVKPVNGTFGNGVIRVEKQDGEEELSYVLQSGVRIYRYPSFDPLYRKLLAVKLRKPYLAQQGIELLKYARRRFDLRVMVQKNPKDEWETTEMIGRLAHPRKIVTNYHSGATPMTVEKLLGPHMDRRQLDGFRKDLNKLGVSAAEALENIFPKVKEIGVDVAIDGRKKMWVLEVNTMPDPFLFRRLPDRAVFSKIYRYAVRYGRFRRRTG